MSVERPLEVELKYVVRDELASSRLLAAERIGPFEAEPAARPAQVEDRYVDGPDAALARAGYAARLRRRHAGIVLTLKSTASLGGLGASPALHRREELEGPAGPTLDPAAWPPSAARSVILELCGDAPLVELVTVRQVRRTRALRSGRTLAELSLDEVEIVNAGRLVERFSELEVELRGGPEAPLRALSRILDGDAAFEPSTHSKLERALEALRRPHNGPEAELDGRRSEAIAAVVSAWAAGQLARPGGTLPDATVPDAAAPDPRRETATDDGGGLPEVIGPEAAEPEVEARPRSPGVTADDPLAEAGRKVLRFHFARLLAREAGTRAGRDPEELHAMRVATRRMRAAWRVFGEAFRTRRTRRLRERLRILAGRLGAVRDLDVLLDGLVAYRAGLDPTEAAALEPLVAAWEAQRSAARELLRRELDSDEYRLLVDEYRVFVGAEGSAARPPVAPTVPHRVRDTAPSRIWLAYERVRGFERVLPWADVETLHALRIEAKRLRYTLEFFREALGPEAGLLVARIVALQDHLGLLHDADVGAHLARAFLVERAGSLDDAETAAIGRYLRNSEHEVGRLRRSMGPAWRGVAGVAFRRALGRAVAAL